MCFYGPKQALRAWFLAFESGFRLALVILSRVVHIPRSLCIMVLMVLFIFFYMLMI